MTSKRKVYSISPIKFNRAIQLAYIEFVKSIHKEGVEIHDMKTDTTFIKVVSYRNIRS